MRPVEFYKEAKGQTFIDIDDPYETKRFKNLINDINSAENPASVWTSA